jgi:hypothetical protein
MDFMLSMESMSSMGIHVIHGYTWIQWVAVEPMGAHGFHGYPWNPAHIWGDSPLMFFVSHMGGIVYRFQIGSTRSLGPPDIGIDSDIGAYPIILVYPEIGVDTDIGEYPDIRVYLDIKV